VRLSSSRLAFLEQATQTYSKALRGSPADEYLTTKRGLSGGSKTYFRLGFVADPLPGHEKYAGCLAIPYVTRAGIVSMRFRRLAGDGPKYLSEPGEETRLYHPEGFFRHERFICLCEGEIDTMTAVQAGLPAVGVPGAQSWKPYMFRAFDGYDVVFILADTDDKTGDGMKFAEKAAGQIKSARIIPMALEGRGYDVNSLVMEHGAEALISKVGVEL
jgi:DNA primase